MNIRFCEHLSHVAKLSHMNNKKHLERIRKPSINHRPLFPIAPTNEVKIHSHNPNCVPLAIHAIVTCIDRNESEK